MEIKQKRSTILCLLLSLSVCLLIIFFENTPKGFFQTTQIQLYAPFFLQTLPLPNEKLV